MATELRRSRRLLERQKNVGQLIAIKSEPTNDYGDEKPVISGPSQQTRKRVTGRPEPSTRNHGLAEVFRRNKMIRRNKKFLERKKKNMHQKRFLLQKKKAQILKKMLQITYNLLNEYRGQYGEGGLLRVVHTRYPNYKPTLPC